MSEAEQAPPGVDTTKPSAARMYDYYLGGTNNYEVDRIAAEQVMRMAPDVRDSVWSNRGFHQRAAQWLAADGGVSQFIDVGSGLPTQNNTHDAVHSVAPDAKVIYVDNDPSVAEHVPELLTGIGNTIFVTGDLRDRDSIFGSPAILEMVDWDKPVAWLMTALLHFVSDDVDPYGLIRSYVEASAPGSYLVLSHATEDKGRVEVGDRTREIYQKANEQLFLRSRSEVERFFEGMELVPPYHGAPPMVTYAGLWGAEDPESADDDANRWFYCGVARKP